MECRIDFDLSFDGVQWIEYRTDPRQGYALSLNSSIVSGYEAEFEATDDGDLEVISPNNRSRGKYECRNLLAPQVRATAELQLVCKSFTFASKHTVKV